MNNNKKLTIPLVLFLIGLVLSWGIWVTNGVYVAFGERQNTDRCIEGIYETQRDIKDGQGVLQEEIKQNRETIHRNQQEMLRLLFEINQNVNSSDNE